jgi:hypothetical protein
MRRLTSWSRDQIIAYNLRDDGEAFSVFENTQRDRVMKARSIIETIGNELIGEQAIAKIVEPGCSTGDISGWFSQYGHEVIGIDVTPGACRAARERWPRMEVIEGIAEDMEPIDCDVLVLCEFLEHIDDPIAFVKAWGPHARFMVIGHPLVGDGHDQEVGHVWAYTPDDYRAWFPLAGHEAKEAWSFPMAGYHMVIGWGQRA